MPENLPKPQSLREAWELTHPGEHVLEVYVPPRPKFSDLVAALAAKKSEKK